MRHLRESVGILTASAMLALASCGAGTSEAQDKVAPGAPGAAPYWSNAEKVGIGTSYEAYDADLQFSDKAVTGPVSKVWFSLGKDRITEVMWGLIHEAQIREIRLVVVGPDGILEPTGTEVVTDGGVRPSSPANGIGLMFDQIDRSLLFTTFTDPDRDSLVVKVDMVEPLPEGYQVFAYIDPAVGNTGTGDKARFFGEGLHAYDGDSHMFVKTSGGVDGGTVGFVGSSDGLSDLSDGVLDKLYTTTGDTAGNVAGLLPITFANSEVAGGMLGPEAKLVIGFGDGFEAAQANAAASFEVDALSIYSKYSEQWQGYLETLEELPRIAEAATDGGALAYMSAINLKVMEDKTYAGALIASLSNPWGETFPADTPQTGYKAVWPRDFFQVASAALAMGDEETALAAYRYLPTIQVTDETPGNEGVTGWFLQKTHVDGEIEWVAIQQDQTAMPIMLGYKLWQAGVISDEEMAASYQSMLKPAADFLVEGGKPAILWNVDQFEASLGYTQQERWEEQEGYSPSTVAAVIGGLVTAGELAKRFGDEADAVKYFAAADELEANIENWMFTTTGDLGDGEYFIRVTRNKDPNDKAMLGDNNGRPGLPEDRIIDGGFLELVRYGVRAANAPSIVATMGEYTDWSREDNLRAIYIFSEGREEFWGYRRYGNDGYGEDGDRGTNYHEIDGGNTVGQRGRVWPFLSGEFAHFIIQRGSDSRRQALSIQTATRLAAAMEYFANEGLSLPEQVWDGVGPNPFGYELGEGTNTATPLAWTHAEYVKLLRSIADGAVWDRYDVVAERYADSPRNRAE